MNIEAVTAEDVIAASRAERLLTDGGGVDQLLRAASADITEFGQGESYRTLHRGLTLERGVLLTPDLPLTLWPLEQGAGAELWFNTTGTQDLDDDVELEPSFFAGFAFAAPVRPQVVDCLTDADWRSSLPKDVLLGGVGGMVWIVCMLTLADLAKTAGSFGEQAEKLRAWCDTSLHMIAAAKRPPRWPGPTAGGER